MPDKYPQRKIITTNDPQAFYDKTDDEAPLEAGQYAAGVVQHPDTKLYQVWVSTNGLDVTCLNAHRDKKRAKMALQEVEALIRSDDFYDQEKMVAIFQKIQRGGDEEPRPLPAGLVRRIIREILRAVVDRPQQ